MRHAAIRAPLLAMALAGALACVSTGSPGPRHHHPTTAIGFEVFYDGLAPYGTWLDIEVYGRVWVPGGMPPGWRPYTYGHWIYSSLGWMWVSDWPWGWAPFHYGRWWHHPRHGWIWIPGGVWAPAWVAWRTGDGWIGWAPLPPATRWVAGVGLETTGIDLDVAIASGDWVFVGETRFLEPRLHGVVVPPTRNVALRTATRDVTRYSPRGDWVAERSLPVERVERVNGIAVPRYRVEDLNRPSGDRSSRVDGTAVRVYRPTVREGGASRTRPGHGGEPD